jgi:hypothetical protein
MRDEGEGNETEGESRREGKSVCVIVIEKEKKYMVLTSF